jgi:hypothetical protein
MTYVPTTDERRSLGVTAIATRASADLEMNIFNCRAVIAWMLNEIMPPGMTKEELRVIYIGLADDNDGPTVANIAGAQSAIFHLLSILEPGEKEERTT